MLKRKVTQEASGIEGWETDRTEGNNREMTFRVKRTNPVYTPAK